MVPLCADEAELKEQLEILEDKVSTAGAAAPAADAPLAHSSPRRGDLCAPLRLAAHHGRGELRGCAGRPSATLGIAPLSTHAGCQPLLPL